MSRVWIARPVPPKDDANAPGLDRHTGTADAGQLKPRMRTVTPSVISREMAAKLSERFGYTTEYWLNLGNSGFTGAGALVEGGPPRNGLILPASNVGPLPRNGPRPRLGHCYPFLQVGRGPRR
jgi:hypothetical protein